MLFRPLCISNQVYKVTIHTSRNQISNQFNKNYGTKIKTFLAAFQLKILDRIAFELKPKYINFTPETASYRNAFINSLAVTYNFTNDLWVKLILQNNTSNEKIYVYGLFGWRFKPPFGNLYFIVNHIEFIDPAGVFQNKYIAYLKLTYPIMIR